MKIAGLLLCLICFAGISHVTAQQVLEINLNLRPGTAVSSIKQGVYNMLAELKMYEQIGRAGTEKAVVLNRQKYIKSPDTGIFYSDLKSGDKVIAGQNLGFITDFLVRN